MSGWAIAKLIPFIILALLLWLCYDCSGAYSMAYMIAWFFYYCLIVTMENNAKEKKS